MALTKRENKKAQPSRGYLRQVAELEELSPVLKEPTLGKDATPPAQAYSSAVRNAKFNTAEFSGGAARNAHFVPAIKLGRITFWVSDGTTPSGTLIGQLGDICVGGASGAIYKCTSTLGTSWTSL